MIFSIIAFALFMAVFLVANVATTGAETIVLKLTLHADAEAGIPEEDRNGNKWSIEQLNVLRAFAKAIWEHKSGGKPISIAVSAVAGSGKTSLLHGMTHVVAKLAPELLTAMTAFNTHIAQSSKDILIQFKSTDGLNVKIFGNRNTVNAGGHSLLMSKSTAEGFSRIELKSYGDDRYVRIARLTLAGWLGRDDRIGLLEQARSAMEVKTTSHAFNNMIGEGLVKGCQILMDEGFVPEHTIDREVPLTYTPPTVHEDDVKAATAIIHRVGINQSWNENPARNLGDSSVMELLVEILAVAIETAFMKVKLLPYCGDGKSHMDAVVPQKDGSERYSKWLDARPVRKFIHINTDVSKHTAAAFMIVENAGCQFPPKGEQSSDLKTTSFETSKKVVVKEYKGHTIMSFENGGHITRIGGKGAGTQFGKKGTHMVDGENINTWRHYDSNLGTAVIKPNCIGKVLALLSKEFGDELDNQLDVEIESVAYEASSGSKGTLILSMADQIYLPHALDLQIPEYEKADVVFVDEVQDLSVLKAQLVWRLVKEDAHKVICGDLRQAIYLFCGASSQAFEDNAASIDATFYPQTICWRGTDMVAKTARYACSRFADIARGYWSGIDLPDYDAHRSPLEAGYEFWPKGALPCQITGDEIVKAYHKSKALHGDETTFGLLCRLKKPLADYILTFIKNGIPVSTPATIGGSLGLVDEAFTVAKKSRTGSLDESYKNVNSKTMIGLGWHKMATMKIGQHSLLLRDLENIKNVVIGKYTDLFKGDTKAMAQATAFQDVMGQIELLVAFVSLHRSKGTDSTPKGKNLADALMNWVKDELFSERGGNAVHIATIHRYKGDEAEVMFIVQSVAGEDDDGKPQVMDCFMNKRACEASPESAVNEVSMAYVAYTRAQKQTIVVNAELNGQVCEDVEKRLETAFNRDEVGMMSDTPTDDDSSPQDSPESDSGGDSEYVEVEYHDGRVDTMTLEQFDEFDEINKGTNRTISGYTDETKEIRHMRGDEVAGIFYEANEAPLEAEEAPILPQTAPEPFILLKRGAIKDGSIKAKMHIDASITEPTGKSMCGKSYSIHPTLNNPKSEWIGGKIGSNSTHTHPSGGRPLESTADTEISLRTSYMQGWGYNARNVSTNVMSEDNFCKNCVKKWIGEHGAGAIHPILASIPVQEGLLNEVLFEVQDVKESGDKKYCVLAIMMPATGINKDTKEVFRTESWSSRANFVTYGINDEGLAMRSNHLNSEPYRAIEANNAKGCSQGSKERFKSMTYQWSLELETQITCNQFKRNDKGSIIIPHNHDLLKGIDITDLQGDVADVVAAFIRRYMVARCFESGTRKGAIAEGQTTWNRMVNGHTKKDGEWVIKVTDRRPASKQEWLALPEEASNTLSGVDADSGEVESTQQEVKE